MSEAYSNFDLETLLKARLNNKKLKIFVKNDFEAMSIKKMMGKENFCVVYLENDGDIGHWITLLHLDNKHVEIFNSLGNSHDITFVIDRILKDKMTPVFANKEIQSRESNNCGRFCILRIMCRHKPLNEFYQLFINKKITPDEISELLIAIQVH